MKKNLFLILSLSSILFSSCGHRAETKPNSQPLETKKKIGYSFSKKQTEEWIINTLAKYAYGKIATNLVTNQSEEYFNYKFGFANDHFLISYAVGNAPKQVDHNEQIQVPINEISGLQYNPWNTELTIFQEGEGLHAKGHEVINLSDNSRQISSSFISIPFWIKDDNYEKLQDAINNSFIYLQDKMESELPF